MSFGRPVSRRRCPGSGREGARLIVSMPEAGDLRAKSGDGSIVVDRVVGRIHLESGDGSLRARDLSGDLTAHTGDGVGLDKRERHAGRAHRRRQHRDRRPPLQPSRRDRATAACASQAEEGSGRAGDWDIVTGDGTVTLQVADDFGAELDARTGDGRVQVRGVRRRRRTDRPGSAGAPHEDRRRRPSGARAHRRRLDHRSGSEAALRGEA